MNSFFSTIKKLLQQRKPSLKLVCSINKHKGVLLYTAKMEVTEAGKKTSLYSLQPTLLTQVHSKSLVGKHRMRVSIWVLAAKPHKVSNNCIQCDKTRRIKKKNKEWSPLMFITVIQKNELHWCSLQGLKGYYYCQFQYVNATSAV